MESFQSVQSLHCGAGARGPRAGLRVFSLLSLLAALAATAGIAPPPAGATILLFDEVRRSGSIVPTSGAGGDDLPEGYGDHVTGAAMAVPGGFFTYGDGGEGFTPEVTIDIFTADATATDGRARLWPSDYGDLQNVVFGEGAGIGGSSMLSVRLQATPGWEVDLYGFELAGWANTDYTIAGLSVLAGATTLFAQSDVLVEGNFTGPRHTTFDFATPLSAQELLIQLDLSNLAQSIQDNIGIDSIRFGQTPPPVPEPGTGLLVAVGLALVAVRRGRSADAGGRPGRSTVPGRARSR